MNNQTLNQFFKKFVHFLPTIVFVCALLMVHNQLKDQDIDNILSTLNTTPAWLILFAFVLTILNYLILAAYDGLALYFTGHTKIPLPKVISAALLSYAISNNTGHAWAAGGSIRYRFYSKWGVPGWDILKISLFLAITYLLGALTLGFIGSLLLPYYSAHPGQSPNAIYWISLICGATLVAYWAAVCYWKKPIKFKDFELYMPSVSITFWQTVISSIDIVLSSVVLWVLLMDKVDISFSGFVMVFVVAQVAGVISQVPGGIGVFEGSFLWLMSDIQGSDQHTALIGALLLFRVIYFIFPLVLAGGGLFGYELFERHQSEGKKRSHIIRLLTAIIPRLYAFYLMLAGSLLVVSGLLRNPDSIILIKAIIPFPFFDMSPTASSLFGLLLLFLARGIRLKIDAAWYSNLFLLGWGIVVAWMNPASWREAIALSVVFAMMLPTRRRFRRPSSLPQMSISKYWLATSSMVLAGSVGLGLFACEDNQQNSLFDGVLCLDDKHQSFWLLILAVIAPLGYGLWRLLSVAPPTTLQKPSATELAEAQALLVQSPHTQGYLALLGDKYLLWNPERSAFIMFEVTSTFWIALSDPIGNPSAFKALLRRFQEQADRHGAKPVFYKVGTEMLPYYLDLGLSLYKLGEEAKVHLPAFSLQGKQHDKQRGRRNKFTKLGYHFEILTGQAVEQAMPCLRRISDTWMASKQVREKGFSLGFFDEPYLSRTDVAVIKDEAGVIRAFANLWLTANHEEIAIDLMRYDPNTEKGIMDYLFAELMLWGKAENYRSFSMGLAPLAGLEQFPLAPLWHKIGGTLFDLGDQFYNFKGLHEYKAKYTPSWESRYLATPGGLSTPFIMILITCLISGGWEGIFTKMPSLRKLLTEKFGLKAAITKQSAY
ncbi:Phosphatidylglycerol lysyltransferase [biofilm metagenome]